MKKVILFSLIALLITGVANAQRGTGPNTYANKLGLIPTGVYVAEKLVTYPLGFASWLNFVPNKGFLVYNTTDDNIYKCDSASGTLIRRLLDTRDSAFLATKVGTGTVTSAALTMPSIFAVGGSPITTAGTFAVTYNTQTAHTVLAGPTSGSPATPTMRLLVTGDMPAGVPTSMPTLDQVTSAGSTTTNPISVGGVTTTIMTAAIKSGNSIIPLTDFTLQATGNVSLTGGSTTGQIFVIKNNTGGAIIVTPTSGTIEGIGTLTLQAKGTASSTAILQFDGGSNFAIISKW